MSIIKQFEQTPYYLRDIDFINDTVGWAVGAPHWDRVSQTYTATIIKTTDGGATWIAQNANSGVTLWDVDFVDAAQGWTVGDDGAIFHTTNGGVDWVQQTIATEPDEDLYALTFTDPLNGWALSAKIDHYNGFGEPDDWRGSVWHTSDGGNTWTEQALPAQASLLRGIDFIDANQGWIAGIKTIDASTSFAEAESVIYYTNDGGQNWQEQPTGYETVLTDVDFISSQQGWAVGFQMSSGGDDGIILRTTDGGVTWDDAPEENSPDWPIVLWDVEFLDTTQGYAVGTGLGQFSVWQTTDGGLTWDSPNIFRGPLTFEGTSSLYGLAVSGNRLVAVGDNDFTTISENPWIVDNPATIPDELGETFSTSYINTHYQFEDVYFTDEQNGWAVGWRSYQPGFLGQVIFHTSDGGQTWQTQYEDAPNLSSLFDIHRLDSVYFTDAQNGWAVGTSNDRHEAILHTTDGGQTWLEQGQFEGEFFAVEFLDAQNGWVLATDNFPSQNVFLAHTTDGGSHWNWVDTGIEGNIAIGFATVQGDVTFTDASHGWAVGGLGEIVHTEDGGQTWTRQRLPDPDNYYPPPAHPPWRLYAVEFINNQEGWIAGEGLFHTTDGGTNWLQRDVPVQGDIRDLEFLDALNGWFATDGGNILVTSDGGNTWNPLENNVSSAALLGISFVSPEKGWLVGDSGTILAVAYTAVDIPTITLAVNPVSVSEDGAENLVYIFTRTGDTTAPLTVNFSVGGTASFNDDYVPTGAASFNATEGSITFAANSATTNLTADPRADTTDEPDETVGLTLVSAGGYAIGTVGAVTGIILDDEGGLMSDIYEPNDSIFEATLLPPGTFSQSNLSIDIAFFDEDWFSFVLPSYGTSDNQVSINFTHSLGDLDLRLYDTFGSLLSSSTGVTNQETISLAYLPPGNYYAQVYGYAGATNTYTLNLSTPGTSDDIFEDNDSSSQAHNFGALSGINSYSNLAILSNDDDWFSFQLGSLGQSGNEVRIDFQHSLGDLDLALYDGNNNFLASSTGVSDQETISLAGRPAGTYRVRVYGYAAADNPNYSLNITAPYTSVADDSFEDNDSSSQAHNFGSLSGANIYNNLTISSNDDDWFSFSLSDTGQEGNEIRIDFQHSLGDLDLALYDANNNFLASSTGVSNQETISLAGRAAGTYRVRVYGYAGADNPNYSLTLKTPVSASTDDNYEDNDTFEAARSLGAIQGEANFSNLVIRSQDDDWYSFSLNSAGLEGNAVRVEFNHAQGDIDLQLYDGSGSLVGGSYSVGHSEEIRLKDLPAGTYFVRVYGFAGASNPNYSMMISGPGGGGNNLDDAFEDNDTSDAATDLRQLSGSNTFANLIVAANDDDWYKFETLATGESGDEVSLNFLHAQGDVDLRLYDAAQTPIAVSNGIGDGERISLAGRPAGTYYLRVYGYNGARNPNYTLNIQAPLGGGAINPDSYEANDSQPQATEIRQAGSIENLNIHAANNADWFKFTLSQDGQAGQFASIDFIHGNGDLDLNLYNAAGNWLRSSTGVGNEETIGLEGLIADTYFVEVYGYNGATNPNYTLTVEAPLGTGGGGTLTPDAAEPNDTFEEAHNLGTLRGQGNATANLSIQANNEDWFKFTTVGNGTIQVRLAFEHDFGDVDLEFYRANGERLGLSNGTTDSEVISVDSLPQGEYFVKVYGYSGATNPNYTLTIDAPFAGDQINPDAYEPNNDRPNATQIRDLTSTLEALSINTATDQDWFTFTTEAAGTAAHQIFIELANSNGNLDLALYDSTGQLLSSSATTGDQESISLEGLAAGTYYAQVTGAQGATNPNYSLTLNAPEAAQPDRSSWVILVYVAADNNLERYGLKDINEMESVELPDNVKVVVQVDRSDRYDTSNGNWTDTRRGLIQHDSNTNLISSNLTSIGEQNMGNGQTLTDFLTWGSQTYTADNYALVLWDHGGGFSGVCWDDGNNRDNLTVPELTQAIAGANLGDSLKVVGFDACLQGLVEQGYELRDLADVMVASQQIEPGDGWDYARLLQSLSANPAMNAEAFGAAVVQSYEQFYNGRNTQAATRTGAYGQLATALNTFANSVLSNATAQDWNGIVAARNAAPAHDPDLPNDRDLGAFMAGVSQRVTTASIQQAAQAVSTALSNALIDQVDGLGYSGLGIYLPPEGGSLSSNYNASNFQFVANTDWENFLGALTNRQQRTRISPDDAETANFSGRSFRSDNDNSNSPTDLGRLIGPDNGLSALTITEGDLDWFKFETRVVGEDDSRVAITFQHEAGDLRLDLYDQDRTLIASSNVSTATPGLEQEEISLAGLDEGQYFVQVRGVDPNTTSPSYDLIVDAPATRTTAPDRFERNDSFQQASDLGRIGFNQQLQLTGLTMEDAAEGGDYFTFEPSRIQDLNPNTITIGFDKDQGDINLFVYNQDYQLLASSVMAGNTTIAEQPITDANGNPITWRTESVSFGETNDRVYLQVTGDELTNYELTIARRQLDIDGSGRADALTDGLMALGSMFGAPNEQLAGFAEQGANRSFGDDIGAYLATANAMLDVDGNGRVDALTDGLIVLGYLFGAPSEQLAGFADVDATRTTAQALEQFLQIHLPEGNLGF